MKLLSAKTVIPATAIAVGTTFALSQPGSAAEYAYPLDNTANYEGGYVEYPYFSYADQSRSHQSYPAYHYAYYYIARPEYIL
jgi:hypothetical protein